MRRGVRSEIEDQSALPVPKRPSIGAVITVVIMIGALLVWWLI